MKEHKEEKVFVIGDLHLNHANIIKYCKRPFSSVDEMNHVIIKNWNKTVKQRDTVYFLGDMGLGKTDYWRDQLNGNIIFIKGNHDKSNKINFLSSFILEYKNKRFLLLHWPQDIPEKWKGWVIHGHVHNHNLEIYPFINGKRKTINAGVEVLNYKPLDIDRLFELDFEHIERMETINSEPVRGK